MFIHIIQFGNQIGPNGTISGRRLDQFLSNPTLHDIRQIRANVYINTLEIEGPLNVRGVLDGVNLDDVLKDVVYKHETASQITSFKKFKSLQAPNLEVTMNVVNGIPFTSFLTTDTEQTFHVNKLYGNVTFNRLKLDGLFNFVNITELDMNAIKLFGEQFTDAELVFEDGDYLNIDASQIQALGTINNIDVRFFHYLSFSASGNVVQLLEKNLIAKLNHSIQL